MFRVRVSPEGRSRCSDGSVSFGAKWILEQTKCQTSAVRIADHNLQKVQHTLSLKTQDGGALAWVAKLMVTFMLVYIVIVTEPQGLCTKMDLSD